MAANNLSDEQWQEIEQQLFAGRKIEAIKLLREAMDCDLKEAKETIDEHEQELRAAYPEKFKSGGTGCVGVLMLSLVVSVAVCVTAVLAAAARISEVRAVATIGAPSEPAFMVKLLGDNVARIEEEGLAAINLAGRRFTSGSDSP